jgi:phytoene dehydrogenase-like protein
VSAAVVVGSGPNGLAAAIVLARAGVRVTVFEAAPVAGGGLRSEELTLPGFVHDVCAAIFPMTVASPLFRELGLEVEWRTPPIALAHPQIDGSEAALAVDFDATVASLGDDGAEYRALVGPFVAQSSTLMEEVLAPLHVPRHALLLARFGARAISSAEAIADRFRDARTRALFAGCAAHAFTPLDEPLSSALGLVLASSAHAPGWPVPIGGARSIGSALVRRAEQLGVEIVTGHRITRMSDLPPALAYLFDVAPSHLADIALHLPARFLRKLRRFRLGPAAFKIDWALSSPIPWRAPACRRAATVHVGGTFEEIARAEQAIWNGHAPEQPFILVAQPSLFDPTRAPMGKHTAWAYAHVPFASELDWTNVIESRIEAFAPGFRDAISERHAMSPAALEAHDENLVGGHIIGGVPVLGQIFARPVSAFAPYSTPDPAVFSCSASTPPGGGVHGMCGFHAARAVLARRFGIVESAPSLLRYVSCASLSPSS